MNSYPDPTEDVEELSAIDSDPDEWVDEHPKATDEEIAEGNRLGETIAWDDDDDAGGVEPVR